MRNLKLKTQSEEEKPVDEGQLSMSTPTPEGRQACADCGQQPPQTETNYTLISARHGWRLARSFDEHGRKVMKWRCADCWKKFRNTK